MNTTQPIADLLVKIGKADVQITIDPGDPERLRFRGDGLNDQLRRRIREFKPALLDALRGCLAPSTADAADVFIERLGIAEDLGMTVEVGSPAWLIATGEALAASERGAA